MTPIAGISYHEEEKQGGVVQDLRDHGCGFDIVVIDNGSVMAQCGVMNWAPRSRTASTPAARWAVTSYFNYAYEHGYDCSASSTATSTCGGRVTRIIEPVRRGEADYGIGSRYARGFQSTDQASRIHSSRG